MKKCSKCQTIKGNSNFYKESRRKDGLGLYCKSCWNSIIIDSQRKRKLQFVEYMGGKCQRCGYNKCIAALEFHHKDPANKEYNISKSKSLERSKAELDKCILLCSNCHREEHWKLTD